MSDACMILVPQARYQLLQHHLMAHRRRQLGRAVRPQLLLPVVMVSAHVLHALQDLLLLQLLRLNPMLGADGPVSGMRPHDLQALLHRFGLLLHLLNLFLRFLDLLLKLQPLLLSGDQILDVAQTLLHRLVLLQLLCSLLELLRAPQILSCLFGRAAAEAVSAGRRNDGLGDLAGPVLAAAERCDVKRCHAAGAR